MRLHGDWATLWTMIGLAIRIAQRCGLHRDVADLGVAPWEVEMRRRTWWQIVLLDAHANELTGAGTSLIPDWDTHMPLNINESDIERSTENTPQEREGPTEMIHCRVRYEIYAFLRRRSSRGLSAQQSLSGSHISLTQKDEMINELEKYLEQKYLRYCDPLVPLHYASNIYARAAIAGFRLQAHHPRQYADKGASLPQTEKDMVFDLGVRVLEYANLSFDMPFLRGYLWHVKSEVQWFSIIYVTGELRHRTKGPQVEKTWQQLENFYSHNPEIVRETAKSLHIGLGKLVTSAWKARANALERLAPPKCSTPAFVQDLMNMQRKRAARQDRQTEKHGCPKSPSTQAKENLQIQGANAIPSESTLPFPSPYSNSSGLNDMDWSYWDDLIRQDFELQPNTFSFQDDYFRNIAHAS